MLIIFKLFILFFYFITLKFCSTRKGVQQSAAVLAKDARFIMSIDHRQRCAYFLTLFFYFYHKSIVSNNIHFIPSQVNEICQLYS